MNEKQFLKTMIELLKYDNYNYKNAMLSILRSSLIKYNPTSEWSSVPGKSIENMVLRVPIPMLNTARKLKSELKEIVDQVYDDPNYTFGDLLIRPKAIELDNENFKEHDVVFDKIKDTIIQGIRNAKYTIWVAVAWFTDNDILEELMLRKKAGVNIRIITSNEKSNRHLMNSIEKNFEVIKVPLKGSYFSNRLHDKFCIIDLEFVMHGSYNWSTNAQNNDETLATALDKDFVRKFTDQFMKLYTENI